MNESQWTDGGEISLFAIAAVLIRRRWVIIGAALVGGLAATISVINKPANFVASASFLPQTSGASQTGVFGFASQFGVSVQRNGGDVYAKLLTSHMLLQQIAHDTIVVPEMGGRRLSFMEVFGITDGPPERREERAVNHLLGIIGVLVDKSDGMVSVSVSTVWRSVSLAVVNALVTGVNDYNERVRQSQASSEREFVKGRLAVSAAELRAAEDRLEEFLRSNRDFVTPQLAFQRDRLQREVTLRQQLYNSLAQSYDDVRIREARVTPVITVFEPPAAPLSPQSRGRPRKVLMGMVFGALAGIFAAFLVEMLSRTRTQAGGEPNEFVLALSEAKAEMRDRGRWMRERLGGKA